MVELSALQYQTEKEVQEIGENELRSLVFWLQKQIAGLSEENSSLHSRIEALESQIKIQNENHKKNEMDRVKHSVIIKGLSYHKDAKDGYESRKQTQEVVTKLLATMEAGTEVGVTDSIRYSRSKDHKDKPGLVKLTVSTSKQKAKIYECLTKASKKANYKKNYAKISVNDEIPTYLRAKQIQLEKQAYEIRKKDKTMRTRVFLKGTDIVLKVKGKTDNTFRELENEGEDEREEFDEDELLNESFGESPPSDKSKQTKKKAVGTLMKPGRGGARGKGRS